MNEENVISELQEIDLNTVEQVCEFLRKYNSETKLYLANFVAAVCDVKTSDLLTDTKHIHNAHARWLFWYAYRYMTNESYGNIARNNECYRKFTESCVGICVAKMSMMIDGEPIWHKRWVLVKRIIKAILSTESTLNCEPTSFTLKITPPKGIDVKFQIEK